MWPDCGATRSCQFEDQKRSTGIHSRYTPKIWAAAEPAPPAVERTAEAGDRCVTWHILLSVYQFNKIGMKTAIIAVGGIGLLALFALVFASIFEIRLASAQVDATSSLPSSADATITASDLVASTSTALIADAASSTQDLAATSTTPAATSTPLTTTAVTSTSPVVTSSIAAGTSAPATSTPAIEPPPKGLAKVHIIGTKYTDYFTDGKTITAFPGDPKIDSHFDVPNAAIPTHEALTWDHTSGGYLYDTTSGDLEVGEYAAQPNGSYIENAQPFVSSTSTPAQLTTSTLGSAATDTSSTPSSVASRHFHIYRSVSIG
jgi:hypothetical protein